MILEDILKIKAGTLIKGIRMTGVKDTGAPNSIFMDPHGWTINGMPIAEFDKTRSDPTIRIAALTLAPDRAIKEVAHELIDTEKVGDLTTATLLVNARVLKDVVMYRSQREACREGDLVGMSLGETIVAFQPEAPEIYRKGHATVMCFHSLLIKDQVHWIRTMSNVRVNFYNELVIQEKATELMMEIV